ncbi:SPASM domain-containing protein [Blautia sp. DFI.4.84]|nr:SPASM domain-containing protein [Blautia sp. DFI.4.84]
MKKIKAIMFLGLVVALLVIGFSPISEAASIEGKREKATIQKQNVEEQDTEEIACSSEGENIIENEKEQNFISTQNMSSATENECTEGASFSRIINLLSNFSDIIQNIWWLITLVVAIFVLMNSLFSIRKKANKYTGEQVKKLIQDGKYIPGVFVELNNSKEVLRYFVYGKKWRKRLIKNFNYVYDNSYGEILKKACDNQNVCFRLNRMASTKKILETVNSAYEFHNNFRNSGIEFKQDYKESQILFEIIQYPYNEILGSLLKYSKVANGKYLILTGSAGNGKTNLLCSISELLVNLKQTTIFLNAREIEGDILDFIFDELGLPDLYKKHKEIYLYLVNLLLTVQNKFLFIIVDAINENDSDGFGNQISAFINKIADYSRAKIVVSCRNEYYKERFRKYLVEKVNIPVFEFDLKEQHYTSTAINRIIKTYSNHFNYSGNISLAVKSVLSEQLLLLRIFFEVNKDSNADVYSIRKHEIFAQYIEKLKQNNREYLETVLDTVTDFMIHSDNYDEISITDLEKTGITSGDIRKTVSGFLITDNEVGLIKQYCGAVAVSWYSRFMDGKESNQETIDAVERLVKSGCTTNIHYVVSKDTINEAITRLEMDSFPKGVNAVIFILYKPVGNGIIEKVLKNTDSRIERFISLATKVKHPYRVGFDTCFTPALLRWGDTVPAVSIDACEAATFSMYIDSQMNCYPCSFGIWDKSISESMNSKTLREIWQGDKFVAFREQRKEKCSSCRQMELCRGGCRLGIDIDMC